MIYVPTVNQVIRVLTAMRDHGYVDVRMFDVMVREWKTEPSEVRPQTWVNAHTGYILIGRRTLTPIGKPAK